MTFEEFVEEYGVDELIDMIENKEEYVIVHDIVPIKYHITGILKYHGIMYFQYEWEFVTRRIFFTEEEANHFLEKGNK